MDITAYVRPAHPSPKLQVVFEFLDSFSSYDINEFTKHLSESLVFYTLPQSLDRAPRDKASLSQLVNDILWQRVKNNKVRLLDIVEDSGSKISAHAMVDPDAGAASPEGVLWKNEYMFIFTLAQEGASGEWKITSIKEFVDSLVLTRFFHPT